jgi:transposase InsO family protein
MAMNWGLIWRWLHGLPRPGDNNEQTTAPEPHTGFQFTGTAFTGVLIKNSIAISMDGKGAWRDNVFVERLWRSVKYEEVYLRAYDSVGEARASIGRYLNFYNVRRPHSSLDGMTPDQAYFTRCPSARQPNPGRRSTYRRGKVVQTTGTSSEHLAAD